jgi:hypothetical protein
LADDTMRNKAKQKEDQQQPRGGAKKIKKTHDEQQNTFRSRLTISQWPNFFAHGIAQNP